EVKPCLPFQRRDLILDRREIGRIVHCVFPLCRRTLAIPTRCEAKIALVVRASQVRRRQICSRRFRLPRGCDGPDNLHHWGDDNVMVDRRWSRISYFTASGRALAMGPTARIYLCNCPRGCPYLRPHRARLYYAP